MGERAVELTWYNTLIRIYRQPYGHFNHIEINAPDQGIKGLALDSDLSARILMTHNFPVMYATEPLDRELNIINSQFDTLLDSGLDNLLGGEGRA